MYHRPLRGTKPDAPGRNDKREHLSDASSGIKGSRLTLVIEY